MKYMLIYGRKILIKRVYEKEKRRNAVTISRSQDAIFGGTKPIKRSIWYKIKRFIKQKIFHISPFKSITMPIVNKPLPSLQINKMITIQPMATSKGQIYTKTTRTNDEVK